MRRALQIALAVAVPGGLVAAGVWWWMDRRGRASGEARFTLRERARLDELTPRFRAIASAVLADLYAAGIRFNVGEAHRSEARSDELHARYVGPDGVAGTSDDGPRAAPGGSSAHNFAEALDVNLLDDAGATIHSIDHPHYVRFGGIVRARGGVWGGDFRGVKDGPHFEHPQWRDLRLVA